MLAIGLGWACGANPALEDPAPRQSAEPAPQEPEPPVESEPQVSAPEAVKDALPNLPSNDEVRALVWRAGRLPLAGLPAVRSSERSTQSDRSLATLRAHLADGAPLADQWLGQIRQILNQPYTGQDEIWSASARALGRLGNYELCEWIAPGLDASAFPGRVEAAREALHLLFGVWFRSEAELAPHLAKLSRADDQQLLLQRALHNERVGRGRLIELFQLRPGLALEWVADLDPAIRIAAAQSLGNALIQAPLGELDREELLDTLFGRLDVERDPRAFHAVLSALGQLTEAQSLEAPEVIRLRQVVIGQHAGVNTMARAQAMARLPWRMEGELGEDHIYRAVLDLGALTRSLAKSDERRGSPEPDPMIETLVALQILCDRATGAGLADGLRLLEVRMDLLELVSARYYSDVVRVAACDAFGAFMRGEDWSVLKVVMEEEQGLPALRYGVLGLLHSLLLDFELEPSASAGILELVIKESGAADPDLRRRAIAVLGDPALGPMIGSLDSRFLVRRFVDEDVADLALSVIELLEDFGKPSMLADCLASERFESLAADPSSLPALARMSASLAGDDPVICLAAAERLAGSRSQGAPLGRLQQALELIAALDTGTAEGLSPEGHRQVCAWAWELQMLGDSLATTYNLDFIERLSRVHWPRSGPEVDRSSGDYLFDEAARAHLLAVLLGIEATAPHPGDLAQNKAIAEASRAYVNATKSAGEHQGQVFGADLLLEVCRDRARFLHASDQWKEALEQFSFLVEQGALALPDLRKAMQIMTSIDDGTNRAGLSDGLFRLQHSAILHPTWPAEPLALRMQDLRELSTSALENPGGPHSVTLVELLAGMPPVETDASDQDPVEAGDPAQVADDPVAVWSELVLDLGRREELHELRQRHVEAIARARSNPTEAGAPGE